MCGRYTLYTDEQAEEIRQIVEIASGRSRGSSSLEKSILLTGRQSWWPTRTRWWFGQPSGGSLGSRGGAF